MKNRKREKKTEETFKSDIIYLLIDILSLSGKKKLKKIAITLLRPGVTHTHVQLNMLDI